MNNNITGANLQAYFSGPNEGNYHDMIKQLGKMRGATRVSVGIATRKQDLDTFIRFLKGFLNT